jgi:hypothetical protein
MKILNLNKIYALLAVLTLWMGTELKAQTTVCPGVEYCITLDSMRGTIQWQSSIDGGATYTDINGETSDSLCFIPNADAFYRAVLTTEPGCAPVISDAIDIQVSDLTANAGADQRMCEMDSVMLGGSPAASGGAGGYTYNWSPTGATTENPMVSPGIATDYILEVTDSDGCVVMDTINIGVDFITTGSDTFIQSGPAVMKVWAVPVCIDSVEIEVWGAEGTSGGAAVLVPGGKGGYATGKLYVGNIDTLYVFVGTRVTAFNGGGLNGPGEVNGGNGGGASDVRVGGQALGDRVIVAGGGGGSGGDPDITSPGRAGAGGDGGLLASAGQNDNSGLATSSTGGGGASTIIGGVGGSGMTNCSATAGGGGGGVSGSGGGGGQAVAGNCSFPGGGGGGGGGGYFGGGGGGGGAGTNQPAAGGGGGSSYIGGVVNGSGMTGVRTGNGQVVITW